MEDKQLRKFAIDYLADKIFTSDMCNEKDYEMVFLPLMNNEVRKKLVEQKAIVLFEYYEKSLPRSINGNPIFDRFLYLNQEDVNKVNKYIEEIENALKDKGL